MIWKKIKPYKDVGDIKSASTKFQDLWTEFDANKYTPTTPILNIMEFIACLVKKKDEWTKTAPACKLLHHTFAALTKTSQEVFLGKQKKNDDLHPSSAASLWTAAIRVLGCSFALKVQIKMSAKGIVKNNMKDLQFRGEKLTFDPACVSTKTKTGRFLPERSLVNHLLKGNACQSSLPRSIKHTLKSQFVVTYFESGNMTTLLNISERCL